MITNALWPVALALLLTAAAAIWDLRTGLIPNRLVAAGALLTFLLVLALAAPHGLGALAPAALSMVLGAVLVSIVPALLYRLGGLGGGDLKLLAVVGAALGPSLGLEAELYAFGCVLLYAPLRLLAKGKLRRALSLSAAMLLRPLRRKPLPIAHEEFTEFRFGPAIFAGTLAVALLQAYLGA